MIIEELKVLTSKDQKAIQKLMAELEGVPSDADLNQLKAGSRERLEAAIEDSNVHVYVLRSELEAAEGSAEAGVAGCATLCVAHTPEFTIGFVEAVVVNSACRGLGYGKALMGHLLAQARSFGVDSLHLTSNPSRTAANALYRALGFTLYDTNSYHLDL